MRTRKNWRNAIGLGQIMATLLVVLPTIAFSVTFLISYWNVMQVDYKLKLIANLTADYVNAEEDLSSAIFTGSDFANYSATASSLCPNGSSLVVGTPSYTGPKGVVSITVQYTTPADDAYLKNKLISTKIQTYSYHDQNISVVITCPTS